jgi:hypothetical protein
MKRLLYRIPMTLELVSGFFWQECCASQRTSRRAQTLAMG